MKRGRGRVSWWREVERLVVPLRCAGCGAADRVVCPECAVSLAGGARVDGEAPDLAGDLAVWGLGAYRGVLRHLVLAWKVGGRRDLDPLLEAALTRLVALWLEAPGAPPPGAEVWVVPAPSSVLRALRGRPAVWRLGAAVARGLAAHGHDARVVVALRHRGPARHHAADIAPRWPARRRRRRSGGSGGNRTVARLDLDGRRIVLVDDVLTTGATLNRASAAVAAAGGDVVAALVLAAARGDSRRGSPVAVAASGLTSIHGARPDDAPPRRSPSGAPSGGDARRPPPLRVDSCTPWHEMPDDPRRYGMEIVVVGRHTEVAPRFRKHVEDKLSKVTQLAPYAQRVDVEITHEPNPRQASSSERIELTVRDRGPVVRAEASASDRYAALDVATTKLLERLRRSHDRKKAKSARREGRGLPAPEELVEQTAPQEVQPEASDTIVAPTEPDVAVESQLGDSPVIVRQKVHRTAPVSVEDAINEMELAGHPFYLFIDDETHQPAVVYHRHGWTYGVIRLDAQAEANS